MPMPVSVTAMAIQSRPSSRCGCAPKVTVPFSVNLLALLARLSSACRKRVWSAWMVPRSGGQSTTIRLPFFAVIGSTVLTTSSISGANGNDSRCSSIRPASIFDRSRMSLIRASRCRAARSTRSSGSSSSSRLKSRASSSSISVTPMMALSGVRSSWLILARNCDLCWLATSSCRLLSWISSNRRTFSIAITAWSAKVVTSSICFSVKGLTVERNRKRMPIGVPSRNSGTPSPVR